MQAEGFGYSFCPRFLNVNVAAAMFFFNCNDIVLPQYIQHLFGQSNPKQH